MKQLVCEMCGGTDLVKQDGLFICQSCNAKYSVEEAKKMMVEGTVQIEGTIKLDNSESIRNSLDIAKSSLQGGNGKEAFEYANKALEISPKSSEAWIIKMKSLQFVGTIGDPKIGEVLSCGKNAIEFSGENKKDVGFEVYKYYLSRAFELLSIATIRINDVENVKQIFQTMVVVSFLTASQKVLNSDSVTVNLLEGLSNNAMFLKMAVPEETIKDYDELQGLVKLIGNQYDAYTEGLKQRYTIYGATLNPEALTARKNTSNEFKKGILSEHERIQRRQATKEAKEKEMKEAEEAYFISNSNVADDIAYKRASILPIQNQINEKIGEANYLNKEKLDLENKIQDIKDNIQGLNDNIEKYKKKIFNKEKARQDISIFEASIVNYNSEMIKYNNRIIEIIKMINCINMENKNLCLQIEPTQKSIDEVYKVIYKDIK